MRPGGARAKGKRHELAVKNAFRAVCPEAKRGTGQSRGGGAEVPDVVIPHLHLEAKHRAQQSLYEALKQAQRDAAASGQGKVPAAVVRLNRRPDLVVFELKDFVGLFGGFLAWKAGTAVSAGSPPPVEAAQGGTGDDDGDDGGDA